MKHSFRKFMWKTWMTRFGNEPTELMYDFGRYLEAGPDKSVNMGYRGFSKSFITVCYALQRLYQDPQIEVLTVAGEGKQAKGNAALAWAWLTNFDFLSHMVPRGDLRYSAQAFDVQGGGLSKSESFAALSLFGSITGRRADLIIADDIETPNTASTELSRTDLRERYAELGGSILKPGGQVKVLGTPQTEDTIYADLALNKGYAMRIYPVRYPKPEEMTHYGPWLAPIISQRLQENPLLAGSTVDPARFPEDQLHERAIEYGLLGFRRQFLLWTDIGGMDVKPLKLRDCPVVDIPVPTLSNPLKVPSDLQWTSDPTRAVQGLEVDALNGESTMFYPMDTKAYREYWLPPEGVIMWVDPSGKGRDETVWVVLAQLGGRIFLVDRGSALEGFNSTTMLAIAKCAKRWKVNKIGIEQNAGLGMFAELLKPVLIKEGHNCTVEEDWATGQKEARIIDSLEALISEHRLVIALQVLKDDLHVDYPSVEDARKRFYRLTYQITRITRERGCLGHDDRIDALAAGCANFIGVLRRVLTKAAEESRQMEINKAVDLELAHQAQQLNERKVQGREHLRGLLKDVGGLARSSLFKGRGRR